MSSSGARSASRAISESSSVSAPSLPSPSASKKPGLEISGPEIECATCAARQASSRRVVDRSGTAWDAVWDQAETALLKALEASELEYTHNPGEGAFYGPKLEFVLRDAIGRDWQCGTLQVDLNMPGRLGATYIAEDGEKHTPVMLHRAIFGSLERFIGILLEHHAGNLPLWLSPLQTRVLTITSDANDYAMDVVARLRSAGIAADADLRNEKISYKVREHSVSKVPVLMAVGQREVDDKTVALRRLGSKKQQVVSLDDAVEALSGEIAARGQAI